MRRAPGLAFVLVVVAASAACGKKDGGTAAGSAGSGATAAPNHATDDALRTLAVPELAAGSRADNIPDGPLIIIGQKSIIVEGRAMVVVEGGKVDAAALVKDADATRIAPLASWADAWSKLPAASPQTVLIAIDPALPSELALQVIQSFTPSKQRSFAFVVRTPDGPGAVQVTPFDATAAAAAGPSAAPANPEDAPLGMTVTLMQLNVMVWSRSGLEGSMRDPRLIISPETTGTWLTQVRGLLTDVVARRWEHRPRPENQKTIVVIVDTLVASGDLVNVVAAVAKDQKGGPLFPDVQLAMGLDSAAVAASLEPPPAKTPPADEHDQHADRAAAALQEEEAARFADLLTAEGDPNGLSGDMSGRAPGGDLAAQIAEVREGGSQVALGGGTGRGPRVGIGDASGSDGAAPPTPSGRISIADKTAVNDTSLTVDVVLRKTMSVYMAGLKRCYREELKKDPDLRGTATISFTVNATGRALDANVTAMNDDLGRCMEGLMAGWRFPIPKDADGEATDASFRMKLMLAPD